MLLVTALVMKKMPMAANLKTTNVPQALVKEKILWNIRTLSETRQQSLSSKVARHLFLLFFFELYI